MGTLDGQGPAQLAQFSTTRLVRRNPPLLRLPAAFRRLPGQRRTPARLPRKTLSRSRRRCPQSCRPNRHASPPGGHPHQRRKLLQGRNLRRQRRPQPTQPQARVLIPTQRPNPAAPPAPARQTSLWSAVAPATAFSPPTPKPVRKTPKQPPQSPAALSIPAMLRRSTLGP